jgi:HK97 family phage major capsid protein
MRKHIEALRKKRNAHLDAMTALSELAANDNRLFTEEEQKAFDKDQQELTDIDAQIVRLEAVERQTALQAKPAPNPLNPTPSAEVIPFKAFKGQAFTRFVGALAMAKGNLQQAIELAKRWEHQTPDVLTVLRHAQTLGSTNDARWLEKAAVAVGNTTDPAWAAPLVAYTRMTAEFIELLRAETIFGKLTGYVTVPFNVKIPRQTAGASAGWVGEGLSKPVSRLSFDDVTIPWAKIAVIVVITQELARFSTPAAEMLVRNDLIATIAEFIDKQLLDDTVTAIAGVRPASITNAAHKVPSTGSTVAAVTTDLAAAMLYMTSNNIQLRNPVWLMTPSEAMFLATLRTAQDIFAFPGMGVGPATASNLNQGQTGQSLMGIPVITSGNVPTGVIDLLEQSQLMVADDGEVLIDTSTEASVQMDSAPATPPTPLVSFWQQNLLGIKAERFIYWMMRRAAGIVEITGFPAPTP